MFSVQKTNRYRQENAMGNASALTQLLKGKSDAYNGVVDAVDNYGQSKTRSELAKLMGQEEFSGLTPEQAQAKIFGLTEGRDLGKSGEFMMTSSLDNKAKLQEDTLRTKLSDRKYGQSLARDSINHKNSLSRIELNNNRGGVDALLPTSNENMTKGRDAYGELLAMEKDPKVKMQIIEQGLANNFFTKNDINNFEKMGLLQGQNNTTSRQKLPNVKIPSSVVLGVDSRSIAGLQKALNSGLLMIHNKKLKNGKFEKIIVNQMGKRIARSEFSQFN